MVYLRQFSSAATARRTSTPVRWVRYSALPRRLLPVLTAACTAAGSCAGSQSGVTKHGLHRACADGKSGTAPAPCGRPTGQDREIGLGRAHRLVLHLQPRRLAQADVGQNIAVIGHRGKLRQRHPARPVQLDLAVQRQKQRQHIGKSRTGHRCCRPPWRSCGTARRQCGAQPPRTAPRCRHSGAAFVSRSRSVAIAPMMISVSVSSIVSSPKADRSMAVPTLIFSILSQSIPPSTRLGFFLVQLPCLLQRGGAGIFAYRHHGSISVFSVLGEKITLFVDRYFYSTIKSGIIPLLF